MAFQIAQDPAADEVLEDPFALLVGMMLDQQYPMDNGLSFGDQGGPVIWDVYRAAYTSR